MNKLKEVFTNIVIGIFGLAVFTTPFVLTVAIAWNWPVVAIVIGLTIFAYIAGKEIRNRY